MTSTGSQANLVEGMMLNEPRLVAGVATNQAEDFVGNLGNPTRAVKYPHQHLTTVTRRSVLET